MRRRQRRVGSRTAREHLDEIFRLARAPGSNHRNARGIAHRGGERTIEPSLHAIGVHRSQQDFARAQRLAARGPFDGVDAFVMTAAFRKNIPPAASTLAGVDRQHHRLRAELLRQFADQFRTPHRRRY